MKNSPELRDHAVVYIMAAAMEDSIAPSVMNGTASAMNGTDHTQHGTSAYFDGLLPRYLSGREWQTVVTVLLVLVAYDQCTPLRICDMDMGR